MLPNSGFPRKSGMWGWDPSVQALSMRLHISMEVVRRMAARASSGASEGSLSKDDSFSLKRALQRFPLKPALTAGGLVLTGDTIAQFVQRRKTKIAAEESAKEKGPCCKKKILDQAEADFWKHDFVRALRMASYGFLLYGPGSSAWYSFLDAALPTKSAQNLALKVGANQVVLGPCVLLVVFAWNFAWMGKIKELPEKYRQDLVPSLVDGWKFWIPASVINFGLVPLPARVAFMSSCAIFWNFYLSSSIGKETVKKAVE